MTDWHDTIEHASALIAVVMTVWAILIYRLPVYLVPRFMWEKATFPLVLIVLASLSSGVSVVFFLARTLPGWRHGDALPGLRHLAAFYLLLFALMGPLFAFSLLTGLG